MENLQIDRQALAAKVEQAQREAREAMAWALFVRKHHEVLNCEASQRIAADYFNGEEISSAGLEEAINNPAFRQMLALQTPEQERAKAIAGIPGAAESPVTKWQTTDALANKAAEIAERRELSTKSTDELRQIIKDGRPAPVEPELGPEWTRKTILALPAKELRKLIDKYGTPAVNRRLAGSI